MQASLEAEPRSRLLPMELSYIKFYIIVFQMIVHGEGGGGGKHTVSFRRLLDGFYTRLHNLRLQHS